MNIQGRIINKDDIELTLSITAKLSEWKEIKEQLSDKHPSWKIGSAITTATVKALFEFNEVLDKEIR